MISVKLTKRVSCGLGSVANKFEICMGIKKYLKFVCLYIILFILNAASIINVYGADETIIEIPGDIYTWTENVKYNINKENSGKILMKLDTKGCDELYNMIQISSMFKGAYTENSIYNNSYKGFAININNQGDNGIWLNFSLSDINNTVLKSIENAYVMKSINGEKYSVMLEGENVYLEPGFIGTIVIDLDSMEVREENKNFLFNSLASWHIGILVEKDIQTDIMIDSLYFVDQKIINKYRESFYVNIEGDASMQLPEHGESIAEYVISSDVYNIYSFITKGYKKGIIVSENGRLELTTDADSGTVDIIAKDKNGVKITKRVELKNSWRKTDKKHFFFGPEELEDIHYHFEWFSKQWIIIVQITAVFITSFIFLSYKIFSKKLKKINGKGDRR